MLALVTLRCFFVSLRCFQSNAALLSKHLQALTSTNTCVANLRWKYACVATLALRWWCVGPREIRCVADNPCCVRNLRCLRCVGNAALLRCVARCAKVLLAPIEMPIGIIWGRPEINGAEPTRREPVRYIPVTLCPRGYVTGRRAGACHRCLRGAM